jgi:hypothetical protein
MLTIFVGPKKETIETVDGRVCSVYPTLVETDGKVGYLQSCTDVSNVTAIKMLLLRWYLPHLAVRLKLTAAVEQAALHFLHHYHAKQNSAFDCYSFACVVAGMSDAPKKDIIKHWRIIRRRLPRRGDVVFLLHSPDNPFFRHAAVYIGWGLYLSVWGAGGDLEVATLKDMQRNFEAQKVVFVVPRR